MAKLVVKDGSTNKFWSISKNTETKMIVTNWGKIGGKSRTKEEPYVEECKADANIKKQIEKKMLRGYRLEEQPVEIPSNVNLDRLKQKTDNFERSVDGI